MNILGQLTNNGAIMLYENITDWTNLLRAFRKAARGKRGRLAAACFEHQIADRLIELQDALVMQQYKPGDYVHFVIHEPKQRLISAAPFCDRVVHHALCNVIEPAFERGFIFDSYANRRYKGTHKALDRLQVFASHYQYVLRADVVKHFPSLDHEALKNTLFKRIYDQKIRWLIETIIASGVGILKDEYEMVYFPGDDLFAINRPRGLPIGNLTSQFWSNCYLDPFDHFVKRELRCKAYLRYVDDFALFSDDKRELYAWKRAIIDRMAGLRLTIHEISAQVTPTRDGIPWLGFVVYPTHRKLKRRNAVNFTRRFSHNWTAYQNGEITFAELDASVKGWVNHVRYADTWGLRGHIFGLNKTA